MLRIKQATMEHAELMQKTRMESTHGISAPRALQDSLERSLYAWTLLDDEKPLVIWGVISESFTSEHGYLWAILSNDVKDHPLAVARISKEVVRDCSNEFMKLDVTTDPQYSLADRWVKWLGFKPITPRFPETRQYRLEAA